MGIDAQLKICLLIGDPVTRSLSPAMHNAAYMALGIENEYAFKALKVTPGELARTIDDARLNVHALAVTIPHKESIIPFLDSLDQSAKAIGAVNTVINVNGKLTGYNTDCFGAMAALKQYTQLNGKKVAVYGSGGSARAIVYGLVNEKCDITIYSRNREKGYQLARHYGCNYESWEKRKNASYSDIMINATPAGGDEIFGDSYREGQILFDINYTNGFQGKLQGVITIIGLEMLLYQGMKQFEIYSGLKAPEEAMRKQLQILPSHANTH